MLQLGARLDPEFGVQSRLEVGEHRQRVLGTPGSVQSLYEQASGVFPQGVVSDEIAQLVQDGVVPPEGEHRRGTVFDQIEALFQKSEMGREGERPARPGERVAVPELEGGVKLGESGGGVGGEKGTSGLQMPGEARRIDGDLVAVEPVAW
ncbi:hypothetical protein MJQ72_20315 [Amycolatopsis sp. EV170708-02-1]|nr:hypothetical protein [Amycolatopsis sp. EV170708-02-1]UMP07009.1 hypothetical protein MJQ72_20315 [Amycolatopsis sp. EV170708-02-1]